MNPDTPQSGKRAGGKPGARAGGASEGASGFDPNPSSMPDESMAVTADTSDVYGSTQPPGAGPGEQRPGSRLIEQVKDKATSQLYSQKERATAGLGSVADAVRQTGRQLRDQRHDAVAEMVEGAAAQLERFSNHLKDRNLDDLVNDAQRLARQQPALFIGSSFAAGLLAARFIKASSPSRGDRWSGSSGDWREVTGRGGESLHGPAGGDLRTRSTGAGYPPSEADRPSAEDIRDRGSL